MGYDLAFRACHVCIERGTIFVEYRKASLDTQLRISARHKEWKLGIFVKINFRKKSFLFETLRKIGCGDRI